MTQHEAELERMARELEELSYAVSHDLSAPVRAIIGYVEVLNEEYAGQLGDGAEYLGRVTRASRRLEELMAGLVEYSRLARAEVNKLPLDVSQLVLELAAAMPQPPGQTVEWVIPPELPANGDRQLIHTALRHLLTNAVKFTSTRENPKVTLRAVDSDHAEVVFAIEDNGIGVDTAQFQGKGFRLFRRFHPSSMYSGHGVGLACTRVIVESHGGRMWCESTPGAGATFYVALPR